MRARLVGGHHPGVADGAVDLGHHRGARSGVGRGGAGMALDAGDLAMGRVLQLAVVDVQAGGGPVVLDLQARFGVAGQAFLVAHPLAVEHPAGLVRLVALDADGDLVGFLLPELTADHLLVHLLDAPVADLAGLGHVVAIDGRARIRVRQHVVSGVAVGADGRDGQAALEKPLAMDAEGVVREDAVLGYVVEPGDGRPLLVAAPAHEGDVELGHARGVVRGGKNVVGAVAVPAARGQSLAAGRGLSMKALPVDLGHVVVAEGAVHRRQVLGVGEIAAHQVLVAVDAGQARLAVDRALVLRQVHEERDDAAVPVRGQLGVLVADETVPGLLAEDPRCAGDQQQDDQEGRKP